MREVANERDATVGFGSLDRNHSRNNDAWVAETFDLRAARLSQNASGDWATNRDVLRLGVQLNLVS